MLFVVGLSFGRSLSGHILTDQVGTGGEGVGGGGAEGRRAEVDRLRVVVIRVRNASVSVNRRCRSTKIVAVIFLNFLLHSIQEVGRHFFLSCCIPANNVILRTDAVHV